MVLTLDGALTAWGWTSAQIEAVLNGNCRPVAEQVGPTTSRLEQLAYLDPVGKMLTNPERE